MVMSADKIKVIERTTSERKQDMLDLFNEVEPLLQKGVPLTNAVAEVKGLEHRGFQNRAWYKELKQYVLDNGYYMRR